MIGSEGTLGVITEAVLKLNPLPRNTLVFFFSIRDFNTLLELFAFCRKRFASLSAFECLDQLSIESVMKHFKLGLPVSTPGEVYAVMEIENTALEEIEAPLTEILEQKLALDAVLAQNDKESKALWQYREGVAESILHEHDVHQQDVSVPVSKLESFYAAIQSRYENTFPEFKVHFFGHIGDGNLHIFVQKPSSMAKDEFHEKAKSSDLELFRVLQQYKGSVSAEHGIGLLKKHALHFTRSETEIALMRGVKRSFDPKGLLNPGKIFD